MKHYDFDCVVRFIRQLYDTDGFVPLHVPFFGGKEKQYLLDCIESGYVSSVGVYVDRFERMTEEYTGIAHAVAVVNGTAGLHLALLLVGVQRGQEVLTQPVTFVATANAINYCGAVPVFIDVNRKTLGLDPEKLEVFLSKETVIKDDGCTYNRKTGRKIAACVPMHVFGHPVEIDKIVDICTRTNIPVIEDAAESIGSTYNGVHTGSFGSIGVFSFNGNKTITTGGGGMIVTNNEAVAAQAKHLTTTAKVAHRWEYIHDMIGYNYRLPNVNAALGCAQVEQLPTFIRKKRQIAARYKEFFDDLGISFVSEDERSHSNYWLNAIVLQDREERDEFLEYMNSNGIMCRPLWRLINKLSMYEDCQTDRLVEANWLEDRLVNVPSSVK